MRILYAGTPDISVPSLERLSSEFEVCGVLTNPDRVTGRGKKILPPPVKVKAIELGLPVLQFESLKKEAREAVISLSPDILVVFAYGKIFGAKFLSLFKYGGINIHPSLLPKYRGSSPLLSAILNGDPLSGITIQKIALEMDTGDIIKQISFPLTGEETTASLSKRVGEQSAELIAETLSGFERGDISFTPQNNEKASYCKKVQKSDGLIDWSEECVLIERKIRAFNPWPGSFTNYRGRKLNIVTAHIHTSSGILSDTPGRVMGVDKNHGILIQTGSGVLAINSLQLQGKKVLDWKSFLNGTPEIIGSLLGGSA